MDCIKAVMRKFFLDEESASAVEYSVLVASIIAVLVLTIFVLGSRTQGLFQKVQTVWDSVSGS